MIFFDIFLYAIFVITISLVAIYWLFRMFWHNCGDSLFFLLTLVVFCAIYFMCHLAPPAKAELKLPSEEACKIERLGAVAFTNLDYDNQGKITNAFVVIKSDLEDMFVDQIEKDLIVNTTIHELLHAIGIAHTQGSFVATGDPDFTPIMYPYVTQKRPGAQALTEDDLNIINAVYSNIDKNSLEIAFLNQDGSPASAINVILHRKKKKNINKSLSSASTNGVVKFKNLLNAEYYIEAEKTFPQNGFDVIGTDRPATGSDIERSWVCKKGSTLGLCKKKRIVLKMRTNKNKRMEVKI